MIQLALIRIDFYFENWTLQSTYEGTQSSKQIAFYKMSLNTEANPYLRLASVLSGQTFQIILPIHLLVPKYLHWLRWKFHFALK